MKILIFVITAALMSTDAFAQNASEQKKKKTTDPQVVETACGECQFGLTGKGCHLAVKIDGQAYYVDGTEIDKHGDAHAKDGFCNTIRKAEVTGKVKKGRFKVKSFKLLSASDEKK